MKRFFFLLLTVGLITASCNKKREAILPKSMNEVRTKAGKVLEVFNNEQQFINVISKSVERTFGEKLNYKLQRVDNIEINNKLLSTVFYNTEEGESTFVIVTDMATAEKKVIDCTGTCDCRERLIIKPDGTEIYECTCSSCKMTVETVE